MPCMVLEYLVVMKIFLSLSHTHPCPPPPASTPQTLFVNIYLLGGQMIHKIYSKSEKLKYKRETVKDELKITITD